MKILVVLVCLSFWALPAESQVGNLPKTTKNRSISFDQYCHEHAVTVLESSSKDVVFNGTVPNIQSNDYQAYGVSLVEDKAQYFKVENSNKILKVESLYRLKLAYEQK